MLDADINTEQNTEHATYNKAKQSILNIINIMGETTSWQIALITKQTPEAAAMCLLRYHRQGLLHRRKLHGKTKCYSLTQRGEERLDWLCENYRNE